MFEASQLTAWSALSGGGTTVATTGGWSGAGGPEAAVDIDNVDGRRLDTFQIGKNDFLQNQSEYRTRGFTQAGWFPTYRGSHPQITTENLRDFRTLFIHLTAE